MFSFKNLRLKNEKKENEEKLKRLNGREVKYVSRRNGITYEEMVMGTNGIINVSNNEFAIICSDKVIFSSPIKNLFGSDLMSLDGMILTHYDEYNKADDQLMVYYKYYRKVD